jgi:hypothetical protein
LNPANTTKALIVGWTALIAIDAAAAPPAGRATQVDHLRRLEADSQRQFQRDHAAIVAWAKQQGVALRSENANGKITELLFVRDGFPYAYETLNARAADSVSTDELWPGGSSGLDLSGAGVVLHEWDGGEVRVSHLELFGVATWADDTNPGLSSHATHVAGTMVGLGIDSDARGMARGATLQAYDWSNDDAEMAAAAAAGARVSNHSYSWVRGWCFCSGQWYWYGNTSISQTEDALFGFYDNSSRAWDDIAYNAPYYLICKSAGNERNDSHSGGHYVWSGSGWVWSTRARGADGGASGYDCIGQQGSAKNILTVGAVNDVVGGYAGAGGVTMSSFSSWGPTDDGRIKPDLVANGVGLLSSVASNDFSYSSYSGTSMSSPSAAGSLGLLIQHYRATHAGADMRSAALKGLALHTADECGGNPGPDYSFGWGLLNAKRAAEQISLDETVPHAIQELNLADGVTIEQTWSSDGSAPVKATICWTDPAGTPVALSLDPPDLMLVNDLDLRVIGPDGTVHSPWILSPGNPAAAAVRGDNFRDNVEVVLIDAPDPGIYTFRVTHKGTLTNGSQDFGLIISGADGAGCPPGEIADCNGNCAPAAWLGDGVCDDGANMYGGVPIDFSCAAYSYDGGDCPAPDIPFILFHHRTSGRNALWFMDGAARRAETGLLRTMGGGWTVVGSGDFDADGNADLMWRNLSNGRNQIWFMDGTSLTPDIQVMSTVSAGWLVVAVDDFDGDGKADILFRHRTSGRNALWFMDGTTMRPETGLLLTLGGGWDVAGTGDFDADGDADIMWRNRANGRNQIWFMDGTSLTPDIQVMSTVSAGWLVVAVDDFDADGKADILFRHRTSGRNALWFMDGTTMRPETGLLLTVGGSWTVASTQDFDADGYPDILWRNRANGKNQIWFMDGTSLAPDISVVSTVGASWDVVATDAVGGGG